MLKLFKRKPSKEEINRIVDEIHNSFYTELVVNERFN